MHVHCKHASAQVSVYQADVVPKSDRFAITEFVATKRLCKYIFASVIFAPAAQILVVLAFEFVMFCHTMLLGIIRIIILELENRLKSKEQSQLHY